MVVVGMRGTEDVCLYELRLSKHFARKGRGTYPLVPLPAGGTPAEGDRLMRPATLDQSPAE